MTCIIFTPEEKAELTGKYGIYTELNPVELKNGKFAVSTAVLKDENFCSIWQELDSLPKEELTEEDFL